MALTPMYCLMVGLYETFRLEGRVDNDDNAGEAVMHHDSMLSGTCLLSF